MNKNRRIGTMVATAIAVTGMATAGMAAPAAASSYYRGPQPVSNRLHAVKANQSSWVNIYWRTGKEICDVEVRVRAADVDIEYPGKRHYTSFSKKDALRPGRTDYTAFKIDQDFRKSGTVRLRATIAFNDCDDHDRTLKKTFALTLPVVRGGNDGGHGEHDGGYGGTKPDGTKPDGYGHKPSGHKPSAHKPSGHKPSGHKPSGHKPSGHKPSGHKPTGTKPGGY